ncbi:MAG: gamma-glutamyltransferase [Leptospirales bacterium]|nr:gamma-glutamyltransferase [Leptospirales bacterium]
MKRRILIGALGGCTLLFFLSQLNRREIIPYEDPQGHHKEAHSVKRFSIVAGTPFSAKAGYDVLSRGGNAADAAVAALLALNVTFSEAVSFPSVAPLLYYDASSGRVESYIGAGKAPEKATIEYFRSKGHSVIPKMSILAQLIPASPDVAIRLLSNHGTKSYCELSTPAIDLARNGYPILRTTAKNLDMNIFKRLGYKFLMPYNAHVFLEDRWWQPIKAGGRLRLPDLANTLDELCHAEEAALRAGKNRGEALAAVREYFYEGPIAQKIVQFHEKEGGLFTANDLRTYRGGIEKPLSTSFKDVELLTNDTWNQGIVVLMALQILENIDFSKIEHNSPDYIHKVTQAIELAMADREAFVGDPAFANVPTAGLLSKGYASRRAKSLSARAFGKTPDPGNPWEFETLRKRTSVNPNPGNTAIAAAPAGLSDAETLGQKLSPWKRNVGKDTSYIAIVDARGNAVSLTPSDFPMSPMVPGTGLTLGIRMTQFKLDPGSPAGLAPGKRPRITPHAMMVRKNGKLFMVLGTPGGDMQAQALVQILMNCLVYRMPIQEAIEKPRFRSRNWPDSFSPHEYFPGQLDLEASLYKADAQSLKNYGYNVSEFPDWDNAFSAPGAIVLENNHMNLGADPRESTTAMGD